MMSNDFDVSTVVTNLKTWLESLSWASPSGAGTTTYSGVFTYDNWAHDKGNPFAVIRDEMPTPSTMESNKYVKMVTEITVFICVNWSIVKDTQSDEVKRKEAMVRLREATDYFKSQVIKESTETTLGVDFINEMSYTPDSLDQANVYMRAFRFNLTELQMR